MKEPPRTFAVVGTSQAVLSAAMTVSLQNVTDLALRMQQASICVTSPSQPALTEEDLMRTLLRRQYPRIPPGLSGWVRSLARSRNRSDRVVKKLATAYLLRAPTKAELAALILFLRAIRPRS